MTDLYNNYNTFCCKYKKNKIFHYIRCDRTAVTNYKLNKVSFWDDESKSDEAQKKLSEAWLALSKRAKKKLGEKDSGINIGSFFNFKK